MPSAGKVSKKICQSELIEHTYNVKSYVNPYLIDCGGTVKPDTPNGWYWTSTEVEDQAENKAWLYSLVSGAMLETSKIQEHRVRPIITVW